MKSRWLTGTILASVLQAVWAVDAAHPAGAAADPAVVGLTLQGGRFLLDGTPFGEISFNKFDLFWRLYDEAERGAALTVTNSAVVAEDKALRELHELGFKSVRFFALPWGPAGPAAYADPQRRKHFYAALDKALDLCDAHDIRLVWSLGAATFTDTRLEPDKGWVFGDEQSRELISNPNSRGRQLLYRYIDETVNRYRARKTVLMWEISNEVTLLADIGDDNRIYNGERMPSLKDVAGFFDDVARRIKRADPSRLVISGGSNMRECQWHLYQRAGWKTDTFEEQFQCFQLLYAHSAVDVVDIHSYPDNHPGYAITDPDGHRLWLDNQGYMAMAKRLGKALMIGELGLHAVAKAEKAVWQESPDYFESYDDTRAAKPWVERTLNGVIEAGVPLSYWWCYQSDDPADRKNPQHFDIDRAHNPELVACIALANKRLKEKLGINP
ncbi:MAG TPA: hypothetical protein VHI52_07355 [Verrucomicrobiae bacterium]|nr:hypothetical protein [Verrucomicrobiae bacterium]